MPTELHYGTNIATKMENADDVILSIEPALWTIAVTSKSSFVRIVEEDNSKSCQYKTVYHRRDL